ncbi:MAG: TSUP family transporter [Thiohalocapsa sp.]|nr:TSUP family transporter [Thiohalocapsa sp.]MCF7991352.1 TSUP family transporter [Thiohalocapsa sp.]
MEIIELASILFALALVAGLVDAIAGGGGLITIPALLWVGLSPVQALATNKAQAVFGSFAATVHFLRQGAIDLRGAALTVVCTFFGAAAGALAVQFLAGPLLERLIPLLLIGFALYFLLSPRVSDLDSHSRIAPASFALLVGTGVGFYDGFFGPGTGTFFALGYVALLGHSMRRATAHAKLMNFTSNLAALLLFIGGGHVVWTIAFAMMAGQLAGGWMGAHLVLRHGAKLVRPVLVAASLAVSLKLLLDQH